MVVTFEGSLLSGFANDREILSLLSEDRYWRGLVAFGDLLLLPMFKCFRSFLFCIG